MYVCVLFWSEFCINQKTTVSHTKWKFTLNNKKVKRKKCAKAVSGLIFNDTYKNVYFLPVLTVAFA